MNKISYAKFLSCLWLLITTDLINGAKIIIFIPTLSNSQMVFNYRVGDLLASHGHDVTFYRPQYNPDATKGKSSVQGTKEIRFKAVANESYYRELENAMSSSIYKDTSFMELFPVYRDMTNMFQSGCETQISDKELLKKLKAEKFDLAFSHAYDFCPIGMIKLLEIPTYIWMSSGALMDHQASAVGAPTISSYVPNMMSSFSDKMSYVERLQNTLAHALFMLAWKEIQVKPTNAMFRRIHGESFPDVFSLGASAPLVFVNSEELLDFPRPILHKIIYIGGIGLSNANPLNEEWQKIMDDAQDGVVLFSFGSVANTNFVPQEWKVAFVGAFKEFPTYTFIWKFDGDLKKAPKLPKNVMVSNWIPQNDILGHPKMKAFITHAGYNSLLEATNQGIPLITIPLFGDQPANRRRAERHGIAIGIDKKDVTKENVKNALEKVLRDPKYKKSSERLSSMIRKKPIKGEELVVKWVDFLAEFKELPNLAPHSAEMCFVEYFLLDIFATIFLAAILFFYVLFKCCQLSFKRCCRSNVTEKEKTQ